MDRAIPTTNLKNKELLNSIKFKQATDLLFTQVSHKELADYLNISVWSIRQARLEPHIKSYRQPPKNWRNAILNLAKIQLNNYQKLIDLLEDQSDEPS